MELDPPTGGVISFSLPGMVYGGVGSEKIDQEASCPHAD